MHDVLDIIRNVQSLYAVGPTLTILKDFERVLDELDVYVFQNWEDGELLSGPVDSRHFVTCSSNSSIAGLTNELKGVP